MDAQCDIAIVGGGMVGISLALALQSALPTASIVLLEGMPQPRAALDQPLPQPSFDARSTAISRSSVAIFERLGLWSGLAPHACGIETIHVSAQGRFGSAMLHATDHGWPALGYVIENGVLGVSLLQALLRSPVTLRDGLRVEALELGADAVTLQLLEQESPQQLRCKLLLLADGAHSTLREQLGIAVQHKDYRQHALIANVTFAQAHGGCAWERFTPTGPLAMLPLLASSADEHRAALVWTLPSEQAQDSLEMSDAQFLTCLQQAFGYRRGRLLRVGRRSSYPLSLTRSAEQLRRRLVVMGNAAHSLHPVAGQGFNLALRDVEALADTLATAAEPLGELAPLQRYMTRQAADQARTVALSDQLPRLFARRDPISSVLRDLALASLDVFETPKRRFTRVAAGVFSEAVDVSRV